MKCLVHSISKRSGHSHVHKCTRERERKENCKRKQEQHDGINVAEACVHVESEVSDNKTSTNAHSDIC